MEDEMQSRKDDHVAICLVEPVEADKSPFSRWQLESTALPEADLSDVALDATLLGRPFDMPLMISGMTGGASRACRINGLLADAALKFHIPFGLGSLKVLLRHPESWGDFDVVSKRDNLFALGNFGAADLETEVSQEAVRRLCGELKLSAVALHLNALQECVQGEGRPLFAGVLSKIERCVQNAGVPVIVKEVGAGISPADYSRLAAAGVAVVDVGGRGGTSWSRVEALRTTGMKRRIGMLFSDWGLETPAAVAACAQRRAGHSGPQIVASGGLRNGRDLAVAIALGADFCGAALPFLRAVEGNFSLETAAQRLEEELYFWRESLRVAMFCCGCRSLGDLRGKVRERRVYAE